LSYYAKKPVDCVIAGLRIYMAKYPERGEKYARGIIRGLIKNGIPDEYKSSTGYKSTGDNADDNSDEEKVDPRLQIMRDRSNAKQRRARAIDATVTQLAEEKGWDVDRLPVRVLRDLQEKATAIVDEVPDAVG
jgi:hypothetical protein